MRLSSIKLAGFKSFCEPTSLDFPTNRTVLVGPNGCGKSNVIDAIRWVLGESSATHLRSDSMEDVIFNGSEHNPPRGRTMVEMVFDNENNRLKGKYAGTGQIRVKRTLERESDSRYYINNSPCRKKDIAELFAGMGLTGKSDYAIVTQGAVHNIVESRPEHIRAMVEEAADITGYLNKRKETLSHIRHTKENLKIIKINIAENKHRVRALEKQAELAKVYKNNQNIITELKEQLAFASYYKLIGQKKQSRKNLDALVQQMNLGKNNVAILQMEKQQQDITAEEEKSKLNIEINKQTLHNNKIADIEARQSYEFKNLNEKENSLAADEIEIKKIIERSKKEKLQLEEAQHELAIHKKSSGKKAADIDDEINSLERELSKQDGLWQHELTCKMEIEAKHRETMINLNSLQEEEEKIIKTRHNYKYEADKESQKLENLQKEYKQLIIRLKSLEKEKIKVEEQKHNVSKDILLLNKEEREVGNNYLKHSATMAELAKEKSEELPGSIKSLLSKLKINPTLSWRDNIQISSGWEKALDLVAGKMMHARLTKKINPLLSVLKNNKYLGLEVIADYKSPANENTKFVNKQPFSSIIKGPYIPSFLDHIFICDSLSEAIALREQLLSHQSLITLNGDWIGKNWAILHSDTDGHKEAKYSLVRKKRVEQLNKEINIIKINQQRITDSLSKLQLIFKQNNSQINKTNNQISLLNKNIAHQKENIIRIQEGLILWKKRKESSFSEKRLQEIKFEIVEKTKQAKEIRTLKEKQVRRSHLIEEKRAILNQRRKELKLLQQKEINNRSAQQNKREELVSLIAGLQVSIKTQKVRESDLESSKKEKTKEIYIIRNSLKEYDGKLSQLAVQDKKLKSVIHKIQSGLDKQEQEIRNINNKINKSEKNIALAEKDLQQSRGVEQQLELELEEITSRNKALEKNLMRLKAEELSEISDPKTISSQIKIIERDNLRMGDVNMLALTDYENEKEKMDKLIEQEEQINKALNNLYAAIKRIDKESKIKFDKTFKQINKVFSVLFNQLSNGGKARLEEDTEQPGIRIMARPPGRRSTVLSLLSGGEKTITAIAFIMAIFHLNPAPFCLMDEADAMLDDHNIMRFNQMLNNMASDIQFILITHNKLSMQEAKNLIGVTMSEPGVSRIVTVDMDKALELSRQAST